MPKNNNMKLLIFAQQNLSHYIHPPICEDPGRSSLRAEWAVPGDLFFEQNGDAGANGLVRVTGSGASSGGSWRRLRFNEATEQSSWATHLAKIKKHIHINTVI